MKKFILLCQLFYPELISTGQVMTQLCEALAKKGYEIRVYCGPPSVSETPISYEKDCWHESIWIRRLFSTQFSKLHFLGKLMNHLTFSCASFIKLLQLGRRVPVLTTTNPPFLPIICAIGHCLGGPNFSVIIADVYPDTAVNLGVMKHGSFMTRFWNCLNQLVYRRADVLIVLGRCMKTVIESKLEPDLREKIHHIPLWTDDTLIAQQMQTVAQTENPYLEKWTCKGKFVVLYSGNMGRFHDMETLMQTVLQLRCREDILFIFVGEGHKRAYCRDFVEKNHLKNCRFEDYVPREDQGKVLSLASVGLVCLDEQSVGLSVPSKTYGLMAAGLPILAVMPKTSEIARMLEEEGCGAVLQSGEYEGCARFIVSMYQHPEIRQQMGESGKRALKEKYSLEKAAERYDRLF